MGEYGEIVVIAGGNRPIQLLVSFVKLICGTLVPVDRFDAVKFFLHGTRDCDE